MKFKKLLENLSEHSSGDRFGNAGDIDQYLHVDEVDSWTQTVEGMDPEAAIEWMQDNPDEGPPVHEGLFSEIYYSVAYKFATDGASYLNTSEQSLAKRLLPDEIQTVDPSLIICSGKVAWEAIQHNYKDALTAVDDKSPSASVSKAEGGVFKGPIEGEDRYVAVVQHPSSITENGRKDVARKLGNNGVI